MSRGESAEPLHVGEMDVRRLYPERAIEFIEEAAPKRGDTEQVRSRRSCGRGNDVTKG